MLKQVRRLRERIRPRSASSITWLRYFIYSLPIIFFGVIINHHVFLTPELHYSYIPGHTPNVVRPKTMSDLVRTADPDLPWKITSDTFKFSVRIPRVIQAIRLGVKFIPGTQPFVSFTAIGLGAQQLTTIVKSDFLDQLKWQHVTDGHYTVWSRPSTTTHAVAQASSLKWFQEHTVDGLKLGVLGVDPMYFAKDVETAQPVPGEYLLASSIRGSHTLYTRISGPNNHFELSFTKSDLNRLVGSDSLTVFIGRVEDLRLDSKHWISITHLKDDGNVGSQGEPGPIQPLQINIPNLKAGLYRIEIQVSDDVLLSNLRTNQQATNFYQRIYLAQGANYHLPDLGSVKMTATGSKLVLRTIHAEGKQRIQVGSRDISLPITNIEVATTFKDMETSIVVPRPDVHISGNGLFAPEGTIVLPTPSQEVSFSLQPPSIDGLDYLVVQYIPTTKSISTFSKEYLLSDLGLSTNDVFFQIDAPELRINNATLGLKGIDVTLVRGEFPWKKIISKISNIFDI